MFLCLNSCLTDDTEMKLFFIAQLLNHCDKRTIQYIDPSFKFMVQKIYDGLI